MKQSDARKLMLYMSQVSAKSTPYRARPTQTVRLKSFSGKVYTPTGVKGSPAHISALDIVPKSGNTQIQFDRFASFMFGSNSYSADIKLVIDSLEWVSGPVLVKEKFSAEEVDSNGSRITIEE